MSLLKDLLLSCVRRKLKLHRPGKKGVSSYPKRFAVCTRFTPPLWSGQAVVIGRLLDGMSPETYCMVSLPLYPEKNDCVDFTVALPGKRYLLPPEKPLGRLLLPAKWKEVRRRIELYYQIWQRGINIARVLKDDSADTIVGCSGDLLDLPAAYLASSLLKRRFVIYFFDDYTEQWWADPPLRALAGRFERYMVSKASKIFVTNEYMQEEIRSRYGKHSEIIRNPRPVGVMPKAQEQFPTVPGELSLIFTGAVYHLNYDILRAIVEALALIDEVFCRLHIYTAQPPEQLEKEGLVGPHVAIHPHVKQEEVAEIQRKGDILLIPFSFVPEAKGIIRTAATAKLADYMAAGRPILALCQEDSFLTWFLRKWECGMAISSEQPRDIADAVCTIVRQPELRKRFQEGGRWAALTEFNSTYAGNRLANFLGLIKLPEYLQTPAPPSQPDQLKVVQVSSYDLIGIQVNGFLMHKWMHQQGHDSRMLMFSNQSGDTGVRELGSQIQRRLNRSMFRLDAKLSSRAMLPTLSYRLEKDPWVRDADIVNLQLIHAAPFFSLLGLPKLSRTKRVVLSVHDLFLMTGHCIYPLNCERWKSGCGNCPDLGIPFEISRDTSARNWKLKRWIFKRSNLDIVIGSPWQEEQIQQSPILSRFRRHMIPYGVDTRVFRPRDKKEARRLLGLPEDAHIIAFRSVLFYRNFKGSEFIEAALKLFNPQRPTVLLIFEDVDGMRELRDKYQFYFLGWVVDSEKIALGLQAADIFLMPSIAEAFGLMAIESMACGTPPIVFDGTALPETIGGPDCGVIVPQGNATALAKAIKECLADPQRLEFYRQNGLRHVALKHSFEDYAKRYLDLYQELAKEKRA